MQQNMTLQLYTAQHQSCFKFGMMNRLLLNNVTINKILGFKRLLFSAEFQSLCLILIDVSTSAECC